MKSILKQGLLALYVVCSGMVLNAQGFGEIRGIIKNTQLEVVPFAVVKILQGTQLIGGAVADENGQYHYKPLVPGSYELLVMDPGHQTQPVNKIKVVPNGATYVDVKLTPNTLETVNVVAKPIDYAPQGVDKTMFSMISLDAKDLNVNAGYTRGDIKGALQTLVSDVVQTPDGEVHFRGSRGDASAYFIDGVRCLNASTIPGLGIENLTVFSGGVPAMYGDVTSGLVIITTKSYFSGIRDKNIRLAEQRERQAQAKAQQKAEEEEAKRAKEIEAEKAKETEGR